jgi:hypothetical protein
MKTLLVKVGYNRAFSIQTNGNLQETDRNGVCENTEKEVKAYISKAGTDHQKQLLGTSKMKVKQAIEKCLSGDEKQANARLIAAAPELLEACKSVVKYHMEHDSGEGELYGMDFVTACICAISKATN